MLKFIVILVAAALFLGYAYENFELAFGTDRTESDSSEAAPSCEADMKQCSDGTSVGRSGPDCQFVCPQ